MMKPVVFTGFLCLDTMRHASETAAEVMSLVSGRLSFFFLLFFPCRQYSTWRDGVSGQEFNMVQSCQISAEHDSCLGTM
jgi:hypothetical protein